MASFLRGLPANWQLKLLAAGLAVLLWVIVSAEEVTSNWIPLPLEVQMADPDYRLVEGSVPPEVEVRFVGPGRELWDLVVRRPPLVLRITEVEAPEQSFRLEPNMTVVPTRFSADPQDVRPSAVRLQFLPLDSRSVPVRVRVGEALGTGWTLLDSLSVQPARVRVSGPRDRVGAVESIPTLPVTLSPATGAFSEVVALDTAGLGGLRLSATRVRVTGQIDRVAEVTFLQIPVDAGDGIEIRPEVASVQLRGSQRAIQTIGPDAFRLVLSLDSIPTRIPEGGVSVPLRVDGLPRGIQGTPSPRTVRLVGQSRVLPGVVTDTTAAEEGGELP